MDDDDGDADEADDLAEQCGVGGGRRSRYWRSLRGWCHCKENKGGERKKIKINGIVEVKHERVSRTTLA